MLAGQSFQFELNFSISAATSFSCSKNCVSIFKVFTFYLISFFNVGLISDVVGRFVLFGINQRICKLVFVLLSKRIFQSNTVA